MERDTERLFLLIRVRYCSCCVVRSSRNLELVGLFRWREWSRSVGLLLSSLRCRPFSIADQYWKSASDLWSSINTHLHQPQWSCLWRLSPQSSGDIRMNCSRCMEFFETMVAICTSSFLSLPIEIYTLVVGLCSTNTVLWKSTFVWLHRPSAMNHREAVNIRSTIDPSTEKYNRLRKRRIDHHGTYLPFRFN